MHFSSGKKFQTSELKSGADQKVPVFASPAKGGVLRNDNVLLLGQPRIELMGSVVNQSQNKMVSSEDE